MPRRLSGAKLYRVDFTLKFKYKKRVVHILVNDSCLFGLVPTGVGAKHYLKN